MYPQLLDPLHLGLVPAVLSALGLGDLAALPFGSVGLDCQDLSTAALLDGTCTLTTINICLLATVRVSHFRAAVLLKLHD